MGAPVGVQVSATFLIRQLSRWVQVSATFASTSRFGRLASVDVKVAGKHAYARFVCTTGALGSHIINYYDLLLYEHVCGGNERPIMVCDAMSDHLPNLATTFLIWQATRWA